jgi:hypothetical protein
MYGTGKELVERYIPMITVNCANFFWPFELCSHWSTVTILLSSVTTRLASTSPSQASAATCQTAQLDDIQPAESQYGSIFLNQVYGRLASLHRAKQEPPSLICTNRCNRKPSWLITSDLRASPVVSCPTTQELFLASCIVPVQNQPGLTISNPPAANELLSSLCSWSGRYPIKYSLVCIPTFNSVCTKSSKLLIPGL